MPKDFEKRIEEKINKLAEITAAGIKAVDEKIDGLAASVDEKIDGLAAMVSRGFEETATKAELEDVRVELKGEMSEVKMRLDRIENILLRDHNNRIERLEDKLLQVEVILGRRLKPS